MAIIDQKINFELYNLYKEIQILSNNLVQGAALLKQYIAQAEALANYNGDASVDEKVYISNLNALMSNIERDTPVPPDILK